MPYVRRSIIYPKLDKVPEVQTLLEARVRNMQEEGYRASLNRTVYGLDTTAFHVNLVFDDLLASEQFSGRNPTATQLEVLTKLGESTRKPADALLSQVIVPSPRPGPAAYHLWITANARPERAAEYAALGAEWVRMRGSQGYRMSFYRERLGPDGVATFVTSTAFADLGESEELWSRGADDAQVKFLNDVLPMMATAWTSELVRVIVPMQPQV
jgi:hypothetical protein